MKHFVKIVAAACAPLLLSGCLLIPGKFNSELTLMRDGGYTFAYSGEMQFFDPDNKGFGRSESYAPFNEKGMDCYNEINKNTGEVTKQPFNRYFRVPDDNDTSRFEERQCTKEEIARERERYESDLARRKKEEDEKAMMFGSMFGGAVPGNDEQLKKFATQLEKYDGWNKVEYVGEDKFDVEYAVSGRFDQQFSFPTIPSSTMQFPFVQIIRRSGGELEILTPAMAGPAGLAGAMALGQMAAKKDAPDMSSIEGSFTIKTDGDVLSNNSEDGYSESAGTKTIAWKVGGEPFPGESPRAIIKLSD